MSEASYQHNLLRGVTGPATATCYLAALDRVSKVCGVSTDTYQNYNQLRERFESEVGDGGNYMPPELIAEVNSVMSQAWFELGQRVGSIREYRAESVQQLGETLMKLSVGGFRAAVYLNTPGLHAVGVERFADEDDLYFTKSNCSPFGDEPTHISDIFGWLDQAPRQRKRIGSSRKTVKLCNIVALTPEKPGSKPPFPHV